MLDDRQHVEAFAIMRRIVDLGCTCGCGDEGREFEHHPECGATDNEVGQAAVQWLKENRPNPATYFNALTGNDQDAA